MDMSIALLTSRTQVHDFIAVVLCHVLQLQQRRWPSLCVCPKDDECSADTLCSFCLDFQVTPTTSSKNVLQVNGGNCS